MNIKKKKKILNKMSCGKVQYGVHKVYYNMNLKSYFTNIEKKKKNPNKFKLHIFILLICRSVFSFFPVHP